MKKSVIFIFVYGVIACGLCTAEMSFSAGIHLWPSEWTVSAFPVIVQENWEFGLPNGNVIRGKPHWEHSTHQAIDQSTLYGAYVAASLTNKLALAINYLQGEFEITFDDTFYREMPDGYGNTIKSTITYDSITVPLKRRDVDIILNYIYNPRLYFFFAYKYLGYRYDQFDITYHQHVSHPYFELDEEVSGNFDAFSGSYQGPAVGVGGNLPLGKSHFKLMGAVTFLPYFYTTGDINKHLEGKSTGFAYNLEAGFRYTIPTWRSDFRLTYRYQKFQGFEAGNETQNRDETHEFPGISFGFTYLL